MCSSDLHEALGNTFLFGADSFEHVDADKSWQWGLPASAKPVHRAQFDLSKLGFLSGQSCITSNSHCPIQELTINWTGSASGYDDRAPRAGAQLEGWRAGRWFPLAVSNEREVNQLDWASDAPQLLHQLLQGGTTPMLNLRVLPAGSKGPTPATISTTRLEVQVRYRLPERT